MIPHGGVDAAGGPRRVAVALLSLAWLLAACGGSVANGGQGGAGGGGTGGGGSGAAGSGGSAPTKKFLCIDPQPLLVGGQDTGYDTCQGGFLRRRKVVECPDLLANDTSCKPSGGYCTTDADCTALQYGHCAIGSGFVCQCMYGCRTDDDCGGSSICLCGDPIGKCVDSNCKTDASCGGRLCTSYADLDCSTKGFACQVAGDECASDSDCPGNRCGYDGGHHVCRDIGCPL